MMDRSAPYFYDRKEAGEKLASLLSAYSEDENAIVIALPRGGVVVGAEVARHLKLPLDIVVPRKIGAPFNPELAIGAITETGEGIFSTDLIRDLGIDESYIQETIKKEKKIALARLENYRKGKPPRDLEGKKVIIVDDGIATGSTMFAAIETVKKERASPIIIAVPVGPIDTIERLQKEYETIVLSTPAPFYAVGVFYRHFEQTTDEEVIELLKNSHLN